VYFVSGVEEAELRAKRLGDLTWVGRDVWCLWRYGNEHLYKEVARRNKGGVK